MCVVKCHCYGCPDVVRVCSMPNRTIAQLKKVISALESIVRSMEDQLPAGELIGKCVRDGVLVHKPQRLVRGLCPRCYSLLKSRVDAGETTWRELESQGIAVRRGKSSRKKLDL